MANYQEILDTIAKFHKYSYTEQVQLADKIKEFDYDWSACATEEQWEKFFGFSLKADAKGIELLDVNGKAKIVYDVHDVNVTEGFKPLFEYDPARHEKMFSDYCEDYRSVTLATKARSLGNELFKTMYLENAVTEDLKLALTNTIAYVVTKRLIGDEGELANYALNHFSVKKLADDPEKMQQVLICTSVAANRVLSDIGLDSKRIDREESLALADNIKAQHIVPEDIRDFNLFTRINVKSVEDSVQTEALDVSKADGNSQGITEEKIEKLKRINSQIVNNNGEISPFKDQLILFLTNKFSVEKPFIISSDSNKLSYINKLNSENPIILRQRTLRHISDKHNNDFEKLKDIDYMRSNSVLSLDSKKYDTSKLVILNNDLKSPLISICRIDSSLHSIDINEIKTMYKKENFYDLLITTFNSGKNIYCNEKTEDFIKYEEGFQLPTDLIELLYSNNYKGVINKSQSSIFKERLQKFKNDNKNFFEYENRTYLPVYKFNENKNSIQFITSLFTNDETIKIDYEIFYKTSPIKNADLFYCIDIGQVYELCQNTRDFSREMNGVFFVYKKFEIVKYIWYNKNGDK